MLEPPAMEQTLDLTDPSLVDVWTLARSSSTVDDELIATQVQDCPPLATKGERAARVGIAVIMGTLYVATFASVFATLASPSVAAFASARHILGWVVQGAWL